MIFKQLNFQNLPIIDEKSDTVVSLNLKIEKNSWNKKILECQVK